MPGIGLTEAVWIVLRYVNVRRRWLNEKIGVKSKVINYVVVDTYVNNVHTLIFFKYNLLYMLFKICVCS